MDVSHSARPQTLSISHRHMLARRQSATTPVPVRPFHLPSHKDPRSPTPLPQAPRASPASCRFCHWRRKKKKTLENCRRSQESDVEFMTAFTPAVGAIMTARYGDFTVMMNSSLRDLPCPAGCKMRTHTHTHTSLTLCSHNVPAWTQHAGAATLNIFLIHIETQN